jgi:toxin CcdB
MARFDVYRGGGDADYLLDCQSDLLAGLNTRFVVPLMRPARAPAPARRLNPMFEIDGTPYLMVTQYAATVSLKTCGKPVATLAADEARIINALDMLISGY